MNQELEKVNLQTVPRRSESKRIKKLIKYHVLTQAESEQVFLADGRVLGSVSPQSTHELLSRYHLNATVGNTDSVITLDPRNEQWKVIWEQFTGEHVCRILHSLQGDRVLEKCVVLAANRPEKIFNFPQRVLNAQIAESGVVGSVEERIYGYFSSEWDQTKFWVLDIGALVLDKLECSLLVVSASQYGWICSKSQVLNELEIHFDPKSLTFISVFNSQALGLGLLQYFPDKRKFSELREYKLPHHQFGPLYRAAWPIDLGLTLQLETNRFAVLTANWNRTFPERLPTVSLSYTRLDTLTQNSQLVSQLIQSMDINWKSSDSNDFCIMLIKSFSEFTLISFEYLNQISEGSKIMGTMACAYFYYFVESKFGLIHTDIHDINQLQIPGSLRLQYQEREHFETYYLGFRANPKTKQIALIRLSYLID